MPTSGTTQHPLEVVPAGQIVYHVYNTACSSPTDFNPVLLPLGKASSGARYSGLLLDASHPQFNPYSSFYFAYSEDVAIFETIVRRQARPHPTRPGFKFLDRRLIKGRALATARASRDLDLVTIVGRHNQDACDVDVASVRGVDYDATRRIASRLRHANADRSCGMLWTSWQDDSEVCGMLTGKPFQPTPVPAGVDPACYDISASTLTRHLATSVVSWADDALEHLTTDSLEYGMGALFLGRALGGRTFLL